MNIKNILFISCLAITYLVTSHNARANENDILNFIDKQSEKQAKEKSENEKITMSKKELLSLLKKQDVHTKTNTKTKINSKKDKDTEKYEEDIRKIVKNVIEENNQTQAEKQERIKKEQQEQERIAKQNKQKEEKDRNKEQNILNTIKNDNIDKTNDNNIDDEQYESKTKKYGWHMNLGASLYYSPYNKKGLDIGLSWDIYYRSNMSNNGSNDSNWAFLFGIDSILHNSLSNWGGYRQFKSENAGEDGKIRERYTILFKLGFMAFHNDNWLSLWYFLIGWTQSTIHIWNNIEGGSNSKKTTYMRAGFGFKVVYKKIYLSFSWLVSSPELYYINNAGTKILYNTDSGTKKPHPNGEHNILFGFGVNFL